MDTNCNLLSESTEEDDCSSSSNSSSLASHSSTSTDYYYDDKSSPMWCTNDNERCFSSSDDDELDLLKYTRRRRRRRSRPNLRKFLPILLGLSETLFLETVINIQLGILPDTWWRSLIEVVCTHEMVLHACCGSFHNGKKNFFATTMVGVRLGDWLRNYLCMQLQSMRQIFSQGLWLALSTSTNQTSFADVHISRLTALARRM